MIKKDMRKELDLNLSVELWHDCAAGYLSILRFAFFTDLLSSSEYKWLIRVVQY